MRIFYGYKILKFFTIRPNTHLPYHYSIVTNSHGEMLTFIDFQLCVISEITVEYFIRNRNRFQLSTTLYD